MNILLTNDDGIFAQGIYALYAELKKVGNIFVAAPDSEKSSVGHGITLSRPIWYRKVNRKDKFFGYAISGTPADCVKLATGVLLKTKPDIIVSGINLGPNDGCSVFYSGTVAGAREGALLGIPSISVSLAAFMDPDYKYAAKYTAKIVKNINNLKIPKGTFLNINVPNKKPSQIKGIVVSRQSTEPIHSTFKKNYDANSREYYWMSGKSLTRCKDINIDTPALNRDHITITPIKSDSTDYSFLQELKEWRI